MSATKSSAKKHRAQPQQILQYDVEDFDEIDRLQNICFPKTPKTPTKRSTSELFALASNGKNSNNNNNYQDSHSFGNLRQHPQQQDYHNNQPERFETSPEIVHSSHLPPMRPHHNQFKQMQQQLSQIVPQSRKRSYDGTGTTVSTIPSFFTKEKETNHSMSSASAGVVTKSLKNRTRSHENIYSQEGSIQTMQSAGQKQVTSSISNNNLNNKNNNTTNNALQALSQVLLAQQPLIANAAGKQSKGTQNMLPPNIRITPSRSSIKNLKQLDLFDPATAGITSAYKGGNSAYSTIELQQEQQQESNSIVSTISGLSTEKSGVHAGRVIGEIVEFIRRVGCELNDLCLTKMSEKSLQSLIEKHIESIVNVQRTFSDSVAVNSACEPNFTIGLRVIGDCCSDLVEKLGDLITRLRMFNKQKFKHLVEQSLSNTLKEIFEESNRLTFLEILTDINVFVAMQRRSLHLGRFGALLDRIVLRRKQHGFSGIASQAKLNVQSISQRRNRITDILRNILITADLRDTSLINQYFFKWHCIKQITKERSNRIFEGVARVNFVLKSNSLYAFKEGFNAILEESQNSALKKRIMHSFVACLQSRVEQSEGSWFSACKSYNFNQRLNWNRSILKVKGKAVSNILSRLFNDQKAFAMQVLIQVNSKQSRIARGWNRIEQFIDTTFTKMTERVLLGMLNNSRIDATRFELGRNAMQATMDKIYLSKMQSAFDTLKVAVVMRPQPISEVFHAIRNEINALETPSLKRILACADECMKAKRYVKCMQNVRNIVFRMVHLNERIVVSLNSDTQQLDAQDLHADVAFAMQEIVHASEESNAGPFSVENNGTESIEMTVGDDSQIEVNLRESRVYNSIFIPLDFMGNSSKTYLVCESVCAHSLNASVARKMQKLLVVMRNRLQENYFRERTHLSMCSRILNKHSKGNLGNFFNKWKKALVEDSQFSFLKDDLEAEKVARDLEEQLLAYKVEIEKNKVHSSNIISELGVKREEIHEIESRLEILTIEKKAKAKCLATTLFVNFMEQKSKRSEQLRRGFSQWSRLLNEKKIAQVACTQIEDLHARHVESRFVGALYLLGHFANAYTIRLKSESLKQLAYNSVCQNNTSMLNFSQLHASANHSAILSRSPIGKSTGANHAMTLTPPSFSPNSQLIKKTISATTLSHHHLQQNNNSQNVVNFDEVIVQNQRQEIEKRSSNNNILNSKNSLNNILSSHLQQSPIAQVESAINLRTQPHQNATHNTISTPLNTLQQSQNLRGSIASIMRSSSTETNNNNIPKNGLEQPPLQLQPVSLVNQQQSNIFQGDENMNNSEYYAQAQPRRNSGNSLNSSYSFPLQQQQLQQENLGRNGNNFSMSVTPSQNAALNNGTQMRLNQSALNLNRSYQNSNQTPSKEQNSTNSKSRNSGQPSNLGYRLSAKTINFMQKFGRGATASNNNNNASVSPAAGNSYQQQQQYLQQQQQQSLYQSYQFSNQKQQYSEQLLQPQQQQQQQQFYGFTSNNDLSQSYLGNSIGVGGAQHVPMHTPQNRSIPNVYGQNSNTNSSSKDQQFYASAGIHQSQQRRDSHENSFYRRNN